MLGKVEKEGPSYRAILACQYNAFRRLAAPHSMFT